MKNRGDALALEVTVAPFGQWAQVLLGDHPCWGDGEAAAAVVWTLPQEVSAGFARALDGEDVPWDEIEAEVDTFCAGLRRASGRARVTLVASWTLPGQRRGLGALELHRGATRLVARMNERLCAAFDDDPSVFVLDAARWMSVAGDKAWSPRGYYAGKIPFGSRVFHEAAADVCAALGASRGLTRKLVIVDLDDTLWGGIIGDDGLEGITLGGHSPAGEAFVDFQRALKALTHRGVVLGICSKNEEAVALNAIDRHSEMVLSRSDFVGWRIDWGDKASNVASLAEELNLGLQSVVFI
ncbi:MAG: HAD-IIIC family phosphatase, partial [Myxococcota bacterium]|nr:HAD-IIIC family phosphatase [Myxococcota bacterium]